MPHHPITLKTHYGVEKFNEILNEFQTYHKAGKSAEFRANSKYYFEEASFDLHFFLHDDFMATKYKMNYDDIDSCQEAFDCFNKQSDLCSIYKYFSEEWK